MIEFIELYKKLKLNFHYKDSLRISFDLIFKKKYIAIPREKITLELREKTKDLETFGEIFLSNIYNIDLPIIPLTIIDAGANVGLATIFFRIKYKQSKIVSIEIEKNNIEMIKKNTKFLKNIEIIEKSLYNKKSFFKICDPFNATNSFQIKEVLENDNYDIESITLDDILRNQNWETIDILKIDIEGSEKQLFDSNYENWLPKTKIIMIETHDRMFPKCSYTVMNTINKYNFILYTTNEGTLIYYNLDFITIPI